MKETKTNILILRRFFDEVWNQGKAETIDELYIPDGIARGLGKQFELGPEMFKNFHQLMSETCSDINIQVKHIMAEDNYVMVYCSFDCIHKQTKTKLHMEGGGVVRFANYKIVEAYNAFTFIDILTQLKYIPEDGFVKALIDTK